MIRLILAAALAGAHAGKPSATILLQCAGYTTAGQAARYSLVLNGNLAQVDGAEYDLSADDAHYLMVGSKLDKSIGLPPTYFEINRLTGAYSVKVFKDKTGFVPLASGTCAKVEPKF